MVMSKVDDNGSMASRCGSSSGQNGRSRITRKIIGLNDGRYMKYQVSFWKLVFSQSVKSILFKRASSSREELEALLEEPHCNISSTLFLGK